MSDNDEPRPETVGPDDLKDAGAVLGAVLGAAVPASVAVGIGLSWLRLHDAALDPLPVLARIPKDQLALEGAQVLLYVVASAFAALLLVFLAAKVELLRRLSVLIVLVFLGIGFIVAAWPLERGGDIGGIFVIEEPARWSAVLGGGLLLGAALIFRARHWNDWRYSIVVGLTYAVLATGGVFLYLAVTAQGTTRDSLGPPVTILLDNPRPEQKGKPRRRVEGRLVWANDNAVAVCVLCAPYAPYRRIVEFPRRRVLWMRVQSRDLLPRLPPKRDYKPFG
jgi:hypothetical protein